jgi:hypothetical protein
LLPATLLSFMKFGCLSIPYVCFQFVTFLHFLDKQTSNGSLVNRSEVSKSKLGKIIFNGMYYISCWIKMAQLEKLHIKKFMFEDLE